MTQKIERATQPPALQVQKSIKQPECCVVLCFIIQQFPIRIEQGIKNHCIFTSMDFKFAAYWFSLCQILATQPCEYQGPVSVSRAAVCSVSWHSSETIPSLCSALTVGPWHFSLCFCLSACWESHDSEQGWKQARAHFTSSRRWESPTVSESTAAGQRTSVTPLSEPMRNPVMAFVWLLQLTVVDFY